MSKNNGFLQLRRGLWEHLRDGRMSPTEALAFIYVCSEADTRTGIWKGCAKSLSGELGIHERTSRDVLEKMEQGEYIRRFAVPGRHTCYPILVHKFEITQGEHDGEQLNALESTSQTDLRYFSSEQDGEQSVEHGAAQRRIENREKRSKKNHAAKTTPRADPRFGTFYGFAYEAYREKNGQPPTWSGKEQKSLKRFLTDQPQVTPEEWQRRFGNYLDSTELFIRKQGASLAYFIGHFDVFRNAPVMDRQPVGGVSGIQTRNNSAAIRATPGKYDGSTVQRLSNA